MRRPNALNQEVWKGLVAVCGESGSEMLDLGERAWVQVLIRADSEISYREQLLAALGHYRLKLEGLEDVGPVSGSAGLAKNRQLRQVIRELGDRGGVRFLRFHTFGEDGQAGADGH